MTRHSCPPSPGTPRSDPAVPRLTWRIDDLATALGVSRRVIERERSAGRLPSPDLHIGRVPLWKPESIREWIESHRAHKRPG
jgi:predicted DNA-binding transcriptional regulator AlpA